MTSMSDHATRWRDVVLGRTTKSLFSRGRSNVFANGDSIYSYGYHFEIARVQRDAKGRPTGFLLNGDRFSSSTSGHQSVVRSVIAQSGAPCVIIPHSALAASGISPADVQAIDVQEERWEAIEHSTREWPQGAEWTDVGRHEHVELSAEELDEVVAKRNAEYAESWKAAKERAETYEWAQAPAAEPRTITVDDLCDYDRTDYRKVGSHYILSDNRRHYDVQAMPDGGLKFTWTTNRHWLGESLIRARVDSRKRCSTCRGAKAKRDTCETCLGRGTVAWRRTAYFLSGFDTNERLPVYFFCELPSNARPTTIAEAYEALKPETVKMAEQMDRTVYRQGDIFAVELKDVTKRDLRTKGARFEKRGPLFGTNHVATDTAYLPDGTTLVRGTLWHVPEGRRPDHRRVTVGKNWHIAIKNTVPISR